MRDDHLAGMHGDTNVSVLRDRKSVSVKLSEVLPGDYLKAPGRWSWRVKKLHSFKRKTQGFRIKFASGTDLVVTAGTVFAGLAGCNAPHSRQNTPALFFARQNASRRESRRAFVVSLLGSESAPSWLRKLFTSRRPFSRAKNEKQFYYPAQALRFLHQTKKRAARHGDGLTIISGVFAAGRREEEGKSGLKLNVRAEDEFYRRVILPLFAINAQVKPLVLASAETDFDGRLRFEVVDRIDPVVDDGPWYLPVFSQKPVPGSKVNLRSLDDLQSAHPWSFSANGVAVFYPDEHVNNAHFLGTASNGDRLIIKSRSRRFTSSLHGLFESTVSAKADRPISADAAAKQIAHVFSRVKRAGITQKQLCRALEKLVGN